MANTAWNPSDKHARVTLSGSNLIATNNSSGTSTVRAIDRQVTGKFYWEYTCNTFASSLSGVGIATGYYSLTGIVGETGDLSFIGSCGVRRNGAVGVDGTGTIIVGGSSTNIGFGTIANGTVICIAVDAAARLVWFRLGAAGLWNNLAGRDPATGVGGVFTPSLGQGVQIYPAATVTGLADQVTANFGDTAFTGAVPSGFTSGFTAGATSPTNMIATQALAEHWVPTIPPDMQATQVLVEHWAVPPLPAFTSWNPSDKAAGITLSGGNLIATGSAGSPSGVRAVDKQISGKFYWEYTCNTIASSQTGIGVMAPAAPLIAPFSTPGAGTCGFIRSGTVYVDGISTFTIDGASANIAFGTIANGTVVCVAIDVAARLVWFRLGAAGNWNNVAGRNPATGVGGIFAPSLGISIPVHPAAVVANVSEQITANFGDSAFTGAVPSGFTSGFTAGATIATNALATQAALEQWTVPSPLGQVTQVALEEWVSTSTVGVQALVTQVALEQWARVPPVATGRPRRVQNVVRR